MCAGYFSYDFQSLKTIAILVNNPAKSEDRGMVQHVLTLCFIRYLEGVAPVPVARLHALESILKKYIDLTANKASVQASRDRNIGGSLNHGASILEECHPVFATLKAQHHVVIAYRTVAS